MIKESFFELREDGFAHDILGGIERDIIGDKNAARTFAHDKLVRDIPELSNYDLVDYLPERDSEQWIFDAETAGDHINTITIRRTNHNGAMIWSFVFGQAVKSMEAMTVEVQYKTGKISDYDTFVQKVNADWQQWS